MGPGYFDITEGIKHDVFWGLLRMFSPGSTLAVDGANHIISVQ